VVCIVDEKVLDFGMGVARRMFRSACLGRGAPSRPTATPRLAVTRIAGRSTRVVPRGLRRFGTGELSAVERELPVMIEPYRARLFGSPH
jgi:hypothetical protein